jgi:H+/Cl- antiporter ClcA
MNLKIKENIFSILKWIFICVLIGFFSGSSAAFFLVALEWVTQYRENHLGIIWFLPIGGLIIGLLYHYLGKDVAKGNNLLLEEYDNPVKRIPLRMLPLVLTGTLITHLFGGSAGREGTAVQMGGSIADQFTNLFKLPYSDRKILLLLGISAGFASVFGTPLAGALFAIEVLYFSKIELKSVFLSFLTAYIASFTVDLLQVKHTQYSIPIVPSLHLVSFLWVVFVSILFGLAAMLFSRSTHFWAKIFKTIRYAPLRPFVGGLILVLALHYIGTTKYIGLGIPIIVNSFRIANDPLDFLLKILFTGFTLGAGFKGGEVTPLFFVGATLGSTLSFFVPIPIALLAGMGFVAVFSGATHTPIACTVMGMELFGIQCGFYIGIACFVAYFCSGTLGIYQSQIVRGSKILLYEKIKKKGFSFL